MDDIITRTLEWVNAERLARDIGPPLDCLPKGELRSACRCPVAVALDPSGESIEVTGYCAVLYSGLAEDAVDFPAYVTAFIDAFDDGKLPEYAL